MTPLEKSRIVKLAAGDVGFDRVGVTHAGPVDQAEYYRRWLERGHAGTMHYLTQNADLRENPAALLDGARSIICVALNYGRAESGTGPPPRTPPNTVENHPGDGGKARPTPENPTGRVARYARGHDYHRVVHGMLRTLIEQIRAAIDEPFEARAFVDTGPLLERQLARSAGIGWIGKNTLVMHERLGSYLFLGEIITTLELAADAPTTDHCGTCTRCLDACPTQAFPEPYKMDASRCISYLTIEHRGEVPEAFRAVIGDWVFGCDVCQEVCPFNAGAPHGTQPEISADRLPARLDLVALLRLRSGEYRRLTKDSATSRARRPMWRRNAAIALGNAAGGPGNGPRVGDEAVQALREAARDDDQTVRTAARAALERARPPDARPR